MVMDDAADQHDGRDQYGKRDRLSIGEMANLTRLTVKALRWYDEVGVLPPDYVDPSSGYRYYRPEQVGQAQLVGLLRQLDMPLPHVAQFLADPSPDRLRTWWLGQEAALEQRRGVVHYLEITLSQGATPMFDVHTRDVPAEKVACLTGRVHQPDLSRFIPDSIATLRNFLADQGVEAKEFDLVLYHSVTTPDVEGTVEVCVPFTGSVEPAGEIAIRIEPAHREAFARATKGQVATLEIMHAYDALGQWLRDHGHQPSASPREVYFADWIAVDDATDALDIAFPYAP